ncbi:acetyl-CoA C-acyltransferase [Chitinophaga sp. MM2321]|uniref:acetyl-CoA C-acyltransferase n=1 Tax=Chitinophaga sp. MM2321 TaxID=3137178 RepID=UPI0032D57060
MKDVYIMSAVRTPIGSFGGSLASFTAPALGGIVIKAAVVRINIDPALVQEVFMGHVLSANTGQAPATQAAKLAGLPDLPATAVNKVCASGMKAIMLGAQSIALGQQETVVAGGMESMSNVPYYLDKARNGYRLGHDKIVDGLIKDGLWDVYHDYHMGVAAELCAETFNISREAQDAYAISSYRRAQEAQIAGKFDAEIVEVGVKEDEEIKNVKFEKIPHLRAVFKAGGTVTAANASSLSDGAAALVLMSKEQADRSGLKPMARILSYADAQQAPEWFTTAPAKAIALALKNAALTASQVDYYEINEAFAVVALANNKLSDLDADKVNVNGGAVALGHPLGASGARIITTLLHVLQQRRGRIGVAAICNGGGGASAIVVEYCYP